MTNRKEDRYFATSDPDNPQVMTYWREHENRYGFRQLSAWPVKALYGPVLWKKDLPKDPTAKRATQEAHWAQVREWMSRIKVAIDANREAAGKLFADWQMRCCCCARELTEEHSKVYGIGPERRSGIPAEALARYATPMVGRLHGARLAGVALTEDERTLRFDEPMLPISEMVEPGR